MGIFQNKSDKKIPMDFHSRSEAFTYMLGYLINDKKLDPMEAAKQANEFAEIFATNMGIPNKIEPELRGVDKYISMAEKIGNYLEQHPKVIEYSIPALTFLVGLFTGKKVEDDSSNHFNPNPNNPNNNVGDQNNHNTKQKFDWNQVED